MKNAAILTIAKN